MKTLNGFLEVEPGTNQALLISKYCLDVVPFYAGDGYGTWENSNLRRWLNINFISTAFDQEKRSSIQNRKITNPRNADFGTDSGNDIDDWVFVLRVEEIVYYFPSKNKTK